jgi:hypothetical protein
MTTTSVLFSNVRIIARTATSPTSCSAQTRWGRSVA